MDFGTGSDAAFRHLVSFKPIAITHTLDFGDGAVRIAREIRTVTIAAVVAWTGVTLLTSILDYRRRIVKVKLSYRSPTERARTDWCSQTE